MRDFDILRNAAIGTVDGVSANEIRVVMDTESPHTVSISEGQPKLFPKINGFALIPNEVGALVGFIQWMGIEHSKYPTRKGFKDFDLIELPFPLRKISLTPVGTLRSEQSSSGKISYKLDRGVFNFPSLGDSVLIPTPQQEKVILENSDENARIYIGNAGQNTSIPIRVDPDKLFGRHLAVLGNTGSGKSCSVAGLIRWSLEEAANAIKKGKDPSRNVNSRFIVLDPNGEYCSAFSDMTGSVTVYQVNLPGSPESESPLQVPAWMWNSQEWISYTRAAPGVQRPILSDALSGIKSGRSLDDEPLLSISRKLTGFLDYFKNVEANIGRFRQGKDFHNIHETLESLAKSCSLYIETLANHDELIESIQALSNAAKSASERHINDKGYKQAFDEQTIAEFCSELEKCITHFSGDHSIVTELGCDTPREFKLNNLANYILASASTQDRDLRNLTSTLELRIRSLVTDIRLKSIINPDDSITLIDWVEQYLGAPDSKMGRVSIIDLSLIPSDVVHMVVAVLARLIFESLQRYRRKNGIELPTTLVLEEAHSFIRHNYEDTDTSYARLCLEIFEKISREGRKFGLGLLLSSQRPSEISQTVLSQCNTFLLHRLVNDRDQDYVRKLVPDHISSLIRELPNLPTRKAILLGWATQIPLLVEMRELPVSQRPKSSDPKFWDVWTGVTKEARPFNWKNIVDEWQGTNTSEDSQSHIEPESSADDDLPF